MSYTSSGVGRFATLCIGRKFITVKCSPLVTLVLLVKHSVSLEVQWFADTLLFRAPVTILVGCRLVLSIREAARLPDSRSYGTDSSTIVLSTVVFGDRPYGGEDSTHCS